MFKFIKSIFNTGDEVNENQNDKNFEILKYDGIKALKIGETAYAIKCFTKAIALKKDYECSIWLSNSYFQLDENGKAIDAATEALSIKNNDIETLLHRASLYYSDEKYGKAIDDCNTVLKINREDINALFILAKSKRELKEFEEALEAIEKIISINKELIDTYFIKAKILQEMEDFTAALEVINHIISNKDENIFLLRAEIYTSLNKSKEAENDYKTIIELNPFNDAAYLNLSDLYKNSDNKTAAIKVLDEAIEMRPEFAEAYYKRGEIKSALGNAKAAEEDFAQAKLHSADIKTDGSPIDFSDMYKNRPI